MSTFKQYREKIWYRIELFIGKGGSSVFYALAILLTVTIFFLLCFRYFIAWLFPSTTLPGSDFLNNFFYLFLEVTDAGNMANFLESPFPLKVTAVLAGMCGIVIFSLLVAILTAAIEQMLYKFSQGTTDVYEKNHFLIIGYNSRLTDILQELVLASEYEKNTVVILSDTPKEDLDNEINLALKETNKLRIVTRTGKTTSPAMLEKVAVDTAQAVIVLSACEHYAPDEDKAVSDTNVIKICYALSIAINKGHKIVVIPEVYNDANRDVIKNILQDSVLQIDTGSILSRLLVQTSLFNGLVGVYEDLFSFAGSEIYFVKNDIGTTRFGEISYHLNDGIVIGYKCPVKGLMLNPSPDDEITPDQKLIVVLSDTKNYKYSPARVVEPGAFTKATMKHFPTSKTILIIGWNNEGEFIVSEYDKYLSENSSIKLVIPDKCEPDLAAMKALQKKVTSKIEIDRVEEITEEYLRGENLPRFDMMVVLTASTGKENIEVIDSENIKLLLMVKKILSNVEGNKPLIVAEVLDTSNLELFDHMGISDFLLSNRLISIFLTQLTKQPELIEVYDKLLSKDGSEIYIKSAANYFTEFNKSFNFGDLLKVTQDNREIAIGYKIMLDQPKPNGRYYDIIINPTKDQSFKLSERDYLIVISDES
jgi:hypothetical protein